MPSHDRAHDGFLHLSLAEIAAWQMHKLLDPVLGVSRHPDCVARLPALQRGAIWKQGQVELLWDSILRRLPIGALVLAPVLAGQTARLGEHSDERWMEGLEAKYHLLDGQQRANAIALGFYDPFHAEIGQGDEARPILWLDLAPPRMESTRRFLFRLTTQAHPWGFKDDDEARPIEASAMRSALGKYGWRDVDGVALKPGRPTPREAWPYKAAAPVPFAWLLQAAAATDNSAEFCRKLLERCDTVRPRWRDQVAGMLETPTNLDPLFTAIRGALATRVVAFVVPDEALGGPVQGDARGGQDIANVEHLFERLNAGGTVPSREEMAYSMIKAYWPEVEEPIRDLELRRMPEARLFMLGVRVALGATATPEHGDHELNVRRSGLTERLPDAPSVEKVRRVALESRNEGTPARRIHDFFTLETPDALGPVLGRVRTWLEAGENGLPPVLHGSIANRSPEVYLLLMWFARRWITRWPDKPDDAARDRILGLATALHWFRPNDPVLAAKLIAEELDRRSWDRPDDLFRGLLSTVAGRDNNASGLLMPPTLAELEGIIGELPTPEEREKLARWAWWRLARDAEGNETKETRAVRSVKDNRELLMYAQRGYVHCRFKEFDPAHAGSDQHNRPWDFDHVLPYSRVKGRPYATRPGLLEWVNSIANLRVWPMEENRSDQAIGPRKKLDIPGAEKLDQEALDNSFLEKNELNAFDIGYQDPFNQDNAFAFLDAAKRRLLRIYGVWHDTLRVALLTQETSRPLS